MKKPGLAPGFFMGCNAGCGNGSITVAAARPETADGVCCLFNHLGCDDSVSPSLFLKRCVDFEAAAH